VTTKFAKLPHDEHYDDWTWGYIFDEKGYPGTDLFDPAAVEEVELWHVHGPEHNAAGLFRLTDGSYVVYTGWCDSTGWDCQSDARFTLHSSRADAIRLGMGDEERRWFAITLPGDDQVSSPSR